MFRGRGTGRKPGDVHGSDESTCQHVAGHAGTDSNRDTVGDAHAGPDADGTAHADAGADGTAHADASAHPFTHPATYAYART